MGGVALGVMALIVVISVMGGFEAHLRSKILGINSHILVRNYSGPFGDWKEISDRILSLRSGSSGFVYHFWDSLLGRDGKTAVSAATPFVHIQALLSSGRNVGGVLIRGVDPDTVAQVISPGDVISGQGIDGLKDSKGKGPPPIILGKELARNLGVVTGQAVQVILPGGTISPVGMLPKIRSFRIKGIITTGMYEYDSSLAFISLKSAQALLGIGDRVHGFELKVTDIYKADEIAALIQDELGFPFWAIDWQRMSRSLFSALKLEKIAMFVVLTLIVLVAAFNIISSLIMMVMEKNQDIAILKAIGATDHQILRIFMYNGLLIGVIGTVIGVVGGTSVCMLLSRYKFIKIPSEVYYTDTLPILLNGFDVAVIAASAIVICFLATIYPSRQAARVNPSEALRTG